MHQTSLMKIHMILYRFASESIETACDYAYKGVEQDSTLADEYFFSRLPVMEKRIAQAGVRLAVLLNRIFNATEAERMTKIYES
ncbi:Endonuclease 2 [Acorus calamus]|uniref:Aspergillus nuclease S1 n=1 Tax=Acorus calamus TaxID=4465 RepID=A0AAV9DLB8_ACOCL|nr:Endonuclease 2 [Acorus calamus]